AWQELPRAPGLAEADPEERHRLRTGGILLGHRATHVREERDIRPHEPVHSADQIRAVIHETERLRGREWARRLRIKHAPRDDEVLCDERLDPAGPEHGAAREVADGTDILHFHRGVLQGDGKAPRDAAAAARGYRVVAEDFHERRDRDAAGVFARTHDRDFA